MKLFPGHILINNSTQELYVITKFKNDNLLSIRNKSTNMVESISMDNVIENHTSLTPMAYVAFNIVDIGQNEDIIVSINRLSDIENNIEEPYAVCRQMIIDFMYQQINPNEELYGMSVSKDTCPANVEYNKFLICDKVKYSYVVAVYLDYTLDYILSFVKIKEYNRVLESIYKDHAEYIRSKFGDIGYNQVIQQNIHNGFCKDLRSLLITNNFMYDFYSGFKMLNLSFNLKDREGKSLDDEETEILSTILCKNIINTLIVKYNYDIDIKNIGGPYALIADENEEVYIVAFVEDKTHPYEIPVEEVESDNNIYKLNQVMTKAGKNDTNIRKAYDHIIMNHTKYD